MSLQTWQETLVSAIGDGPQLQNSSAATSIIPAAAKITLPNNWWQVGRVVRIKAAGRLSNMATTPGTLTLDVRLGAIVAFNGGAMQLSSTVHTNLPWVAEIILTCRAIGSGTSANLMGQGIATSLCLSLTAVADSTTTPATLLMPNTAPAVGNGFDSTAALTVDLFATFLTANAGNAITLHQYFLESLN